MKHLIAFVVIMALTGCASVTMKENEVRIINQTIEETWRGKQFLLAAQKRDGSTYTVYTDFAQYSTVAIGDTCSLGLEAGLYIVTDCSPAGYEPLKESQK